MMPAACASAWPRPDFPAFHDVTGLAKDARLNFDIGLLAQDRGDWHAMDGQWRDVRRGVALSVALAATTGTAQAGEWRFSQTASIEQAYSDNVDLDRKGQERDDASTLVTGGMAINGNGRRLDLGVNYSITRITFWSNSDDDEFRHTMTGRTDVELIENYLFFDAQSSVREDFIDNAGAVSGSDFNANDNRQTVASFNAGPTLRFGLGEFANASLRYRYSSTLIGGGADDSDTHTGTFSLSDGRLTPDLGWSFRASHSKTITDGDDPSDTRTTADLNLTYRLSNSLDLLGGVGWEDIEDDTLDEDTTGITWNAGFNWRPSPKTQLRATYGRQFQDDNLNIIGRYNPTRRTSFVLTFEQTLETSGQRLSRRLDRLFIDENLDFIDDVTGLPFDPTDPGLSFDDETIRRDSLAFTASTTRGRNSFSLRVFANEETSDVLDTNEFIYGTTGSWGRSLSRAMRGNVSLSYRNTDFDSLDGRVDDFYTAALGLTYRVTSDLSSSFSYNFTLRDSNLNGNDLEENAVSLRLSKSF